MNKPIVRCNCGHRVLGKEVLRTDNYERSSGREMVYVKYRCRHCKRLGEAFIAGQEWDWSIFEAPRNEMSPTERDRFLDQKSISSGDVLNFHKELKRARLVSDLVTLADGRPRSKTESPKGRKGNGNGNGDTPAQAKGRPGA